jgi:hypothetical protein
MKWDYNKHIVDRYMQGYDKAVLHRFQHQDYIRPQHSPHKHQPINYGANVQYVIPEDFTEPLTVAQKTTLQQATGCLLYYAYTVHPSMLISPNPGLLRARRREFGGLLQQASLLCASQIHAYPVSPHHESTHATVTCSDTEEN